MQSLPLFFLDWGSNSRKRFCTVLSLIKSVPLKMLPQMIFLPFAAQNAGEHYQVLFKWYWILRSLTQKLGNSFTFFQFNLNSFESFSVFLLFKSKTIIICLEKHKNSKLSRWGFFKCKKKNISGLLYTFGHHIYCHDPLTLPNYYFVMDKC